MPRPITDVRTGQHDGYDRFVIEFSGPVPGYKVERMASSSQTEDASGRTVQLAGAASLRVATNPAQAYGTYSGSTDLTPGYGVLKEARQMGDFEGVNSWGLGLGRPNCFRAFTLTSPSRLVIDIQV
jgi:hypothetical protein